MTSVRAGGDSADGRTRSSTIPGPGNCARHGEELDHPRKALSDALGVLNGRDRRVSRAGAWPRPVTLVELAGEFGVSRGRVRQIEARAFEKVQKAVKNRVATIGMPVSPADVVASSPLP